MPYGRLNYIQSLLYNPVCRLCKASGSYGLDICADCIEDLPRVPYACRSCATPIDSITAELCGACQRKRPPYDSTHAVFLYEFPISNLVAQFKFQGTISHARLLGRLMASSLKSSMPDLPEFIIPVPLHTRRISQRGFNQSLELARYLSRCLGVALDDKMVGRARHTPPQTGLSERDRRRNVRGVFYVRKDLQGQHVAIVDDVVTTGSTVSELARTLKRAGAKRVDVWALARTPVNNHS